MTALFSRLWLHARWWLHIGANPTPRMEFMSDRALAWRAYKIQRARIVIGLLNGDPQFEGFARYFPKTRNP